VSIALAQMWQSLQALQSPLEGRAPVLVPVLVPIRIQTDHRARTPVGLCPYRGGWSA
jgi:hypothetical protein